MAFRLNVITIFLLTTAVFVFSASSNRSENSKSRKKKPSPPRLSANIDENPFLKNRTTTTTTTTTTTAPVDYHRNPFLSATPKPQGQLFGNGSDQQQVNFSSTNPFMAEEDQDVTVAIYIHNPFLQPVVNTPNKLGDTGSTSPPNKLVPSPSDSSNNGRISETDGRTKSDIKCQEYARQLSGTTEVLSLVGVNSEVIKLESDKCRKENRLVIGGTAATPGEFPHMVALGIKNADGSFIMYCGGTLISPEWVLTAAHCTYGPNGSPTSARVGFHNLNDDQFGVAATISKIIRHPTYKPPAMYADIAMVKLEAAVTFNRLIRPACLYQQYDSVPTQAWVSGWGVTEFGGERSAHLQKALLDVVDNIACTIRHNRSRAVPHGITPSMICAGDPRGGWNKDTCQGDSGGPLQVIHPKNLCLFQVIGITSFGEGCAIIDSPGVYTRVSHYLNWIEDLVWPDA